MKSLPDIELANLFLAIATLVRSGMDLTYGAAMLPEPPGQTGTAIKDLKAKTAEGLPLSEAMESGPFPAYAVGLIRIGERSGNLEQALYALSDYYEQKHARAVRVKSALTYPAILAVLMIAVIGVLLVKVLPVFDRVYASLGGSMTGAAGMLLKTGILIKTALPILCAIGIILLAAAVAVICVPTARFAVVKRWNARFGDRYISKTANDARFAQAMAMGLSAGMPLDEAVELSAELNSDIPAAKTRYDACLSMIRDGSSVTDALSKSGALPADACALLELGQNSGTTDSLMKTISDRLAAQAAQAIDDLSAKIEPALVIASSLAAGAILIAVMLPLMDIMAAMQ